MCIVGWSGGRSDPDFYHIVAGLGSKITVRWGTPFSGWLILSHSPRPPDTPRTRAIIPVLREADDRNHTCRAFADRL